MPSRAEIVAFARSLERTPFQHQGRSVDVGLDCGGLVEVVADHFGIKPEGFKFERYGTFPRPAFVIGTLNKYLTFIGGSKMGRVGDVLLISDHGYAVHLGILAERDGYQTVIHSTKLAKGVAEHRIDGDFERQIRGVWRYPGVTD